MDAGNTHDMPVPLSQRHRITQLEGIVETLLVIEIQHDRVHAGAPVALDQQNIFHQATGQGRSGVYRDGRTSSARLRRKERENVPVADWPFFVEGFVRNRLDLARRKWLAQKIAYAGIFEGRSLQSVPAGPKSYRDSSKGRPPDLG